MRDKKLITLLIILSLSIVGMLGIVSVTAKSSNSVHPLEEMPLMDLTHENFALKEAQAAEVEPMVSLPSVQPAEVGDGYAFNVSDDGLGIDYEEDFVVAAEGEHILILVTSDAYNWYLANGVFNFSNPIGNNSEPWLRYGDIITQAMLDYMVEEFDDNGYPKMSEIYGVPFSRGTDEPDKIWTLLFNIKDEAYYDPDAESYIAGYFSLADSNTYEKNIMHIDTYEWHHRAGDGDNPWFDPDHLRANPNMYEGVFIHEYEHMIHSDIDPDEPSWVDEGLADLAGFMVGYGHSESHIAYYMVYHPFTALTFWGSGLEDYGASYLFQLYLFEQFGGAAFTSALVQEQANGIEGIENTLAAFGYSETFDEIFDAWTIANYIDDTRKAGGKYGYELFDLGSTDSWGYTIEYVLENFWWGPGDEAPFTFPSAWLGDPQPYTAQYYRFNNRRAATVWIDGEDFSGTIAYSGTYEWYSDAEAWAWRSFGQTFDFTTFTLGDTLTLNFMTYYEIEGDWDYGYVEVYDQDTGEWYTLDAAGTVNTVAHAQDNLNTPDEREPTAYDGAGRWHAFTGNSGGWIPVSMDLSPFAGHSIDLYFTTWQDGAFTLQMMYVDDISISEIGFFDDIEAGEDGWSSTGWYVTDGILANGYGVTVIDTKGVPTARYPEAPSNNAMTLHSVSTMFADPGTQMGFLEVSATTGKSGRVKVAIVANHAGHILPSSYDFGVF